MKDSEGFDHPKSFGEDYIVKGVLGEGGYAWVYKVWHPEWKVKMAVKHLKAETAEIPGVWERFRKEAQIGLELSSNYVVRIHHFGNANSRPYLVMDYKKNGSLANHISNEPIGIDPSVQYALDIAKGLQALHEEEVLHRDLNPRNILLNDDGLSCVVSDFGQAGDSGKPRLTPTGSPGYQAPEQLYRKGTDERTDIYAFGLVFWEMLSGKDVFDLGETCELSDLLAQTPPIPSGLVEIIGRCIEDRPEDRVQSFREIIKNINSVLKLGLDSPISPKLLNGLLEEGTLGLNKCQAFRPKPITGLPIWKEVVSSNWFNQEHLGIDVQDVHTYFELLVEYSRFQWGSGLGHLHKIWVDENQLGALFDKAKKVLTELGAVPTTSNGE